MRQYLTLLFCVILFNACRTPRYVFAPTPPNNPFFKDKGDSKISAMYSVGANDDNNQGGKNRGINLQAAYALSDHFAVTAEHFSLKERDIYQFYQYGLFDSSVVNYRRNLTSIGAGYFVGLSRRKKVTFNLYAGVGVGKFDIADHGTDHSSVAYNRYHRSNVTRWYLQPGFNFMPGKVFWFSFTTRYDWARYSVLTNYTTDEQSGLNLAGLNHRTLFFVEPAYTMQFSIGRCPWLKINAGFAFCANANDSDGPDYNHYDARGASGFIGLGFDLSKIHDR